MRKIELLTGEIDKIKKELEEYIMKPPISESTLNELEGMKILTANQKEEIENKTKAINQLREEISLLRPEL